MLSLLICVAASFALTACATDHDDNPIVGTPEPVNPPATSQFGLERQDVLNYFSTSLKGAVEPFTVSDPVAATDVEGATHYVWELWKTAVKRLSGDKLPTLVSHYKLESWDAISTPDAIWKVPEGNMPVFYGSKGESPANGYPLFLFLHGSGQDSNLEWTAALGWAEYFKDSPSAYFIPKSPQGGTGTRWFQPSKQEKWECLLRQALISDKIDPTRLYIMGISEGAYGSQRLASFYADYLAGAGPIAGGELLDRCPPENLANIAFTLQTGELDTSYGRKELTSKVKSELDKLQAAHPGYYTHNVELQSEKGHGCDYTKTTPWLINYSRNPQPRYVYWENYGMGDINGEPRRYRDAFYNLCIVEPSISRENDLERTAYEMTINGNTIDITVNNVTLKAIEPITPSTGEVYIGVEKTMKPATIGKLRVYLSNSLVDLGSPVTINVNGKQQYNGTVQCTTGNLVESCRLFYDPLRVFPASVQVSVQ